MISDNNSLRFNFKVQLKISNAQEGEYYFAQWLLKISFSSFI